MIQIFWVKNKTIWELDAILVFFAKRHSSILSILNYCMNPKKTPTEIGKGWAKQKIVQVHQLLCVIKLKEKNCLRNGVLMESNFVKYRIHVERILMIKPNDQIQSIVIFFDFERVFNYNQNSFEKFPHLILLFEVA